MTEQNELAELRDQVAKLAAIVTRHDDELEIEKLMARYQYLHTVHAGDDIIALFANDHPDVWATIGDWGIWKGKEGIRRLWKGVEASIEDGGHIDMHGFAEEAYMVNRVLEISTDGQTARGLWMCPGYEVIPLSQFDGHPKYDEIKETVFHGLPAKVAWIYGKYACDFVKVDGEWKLLHFSHLLNFWADYYESFAKTGEHFIRKPELPTFMDFQNMLPEVAPDDVAPWRYLPYDPARKPEIYPALPEPFDELVPWATL